MSHVDIERETIDNIRKYKGKRQSIRKFVHEAIDEKIDRITNPPETTNPPRRITKKTVNVNVIPTKTAVALTIYITIIIILVVWLT